MALDRVYNSSESTQHSISCELECLSFPIESAHNSSIFLFSQDCSDSSSVTFSLSEGTETVCASQWVGAEECHKGCDKTADVSLPLKQLTRKDGKRIKKAYFRIQLIRAFKKSLRQISTRKWAKAGIYKLKKEDEHHRRLWADYYLNYKAEKGKLLPDALDLVHNNTEKSFSNSYCERFFRSDALRRLYFHFLDLVFREDSTPEEDCRKFNLLCCDGQHREECIETWRAVKHFSRFGLFQDLGLLPWNGSQWVSASDLDPEQFLATKPS